MTHMVCACRPWYSGGTVAAVYPGAGQFDMLPEGTSERFEDGTVNFASMSGVVIGLDYLLSIGMTKIEQRVCSLTAWLLQGLVSMKHGNGEHLACFVNYPSHGNYLISSSSRASASTSAALQWSLCHPVQYKGAYAMFVQL